MRNKVINLSDIKKNKDKEEQVAADEYLEPEKDEFDLALEAMTPEEFEELQIFLLNN